VKNDYEEVKWAFEFYQDPINWSSFRDEFIIAQDSLPLLTIKDTPSSTSSWRRMIGDDRFVRSLLLALIVQSFVHLDDWVWLSYSTEIFRESGLDEHLAQYSSLLMTIPQATASILLIFCFERFSRKSLLIGGTLGSVVFAIMAMVCVWMARRGTSRIAMLIPVMASAGMVMAAGASESAYAIVPELFSQGDRLIGTALCGAGQNLIGSLISFALLWSLMEFGTVLTLIPFLCVNLAYALFVWRSMPETGGRSFQEIADTLVSSLSSSKRSSNGHGQWSSGCSFRIVWHHRRRLILITVQLLLFLVIVYVLMQK